MFSAILEKYMLPKLNSAWPFWQAGIAWSES